MFPLSCHWGLILWHPHTHREGFAIMSKRKEQQKEKDEFKQMSLLEFD